MKRHGNLFEQIVDPGNLYRAYRNARKGKGWQRAVKAFDKDILGNLHALRGALLDKSFTTSPYRSKTIHEPKRREIYILPFYPDRIVQHALIQVVGPIWDNLFISDSYACRVGKGMHKGSTRTMEFVREYDYCLKADVSKFYPSIDQTILLELIERKIKCPDTLWLIGDIVRSFPGGRNAPIGNYTSQWFGNLYLHELDVFVKQTLRRPAYVRYCDDFVIFSNDKKQLHHVKDLIERFMLDRLRLRFSRWSVFPVSQGVDFLGYRHWRNKVLVRKSTARRVKSRMAALPGRFSRGRITRDQYRSTLASTEGWLRWANTYNFSRSIRLDELKEAIA